MNGRTTIARSSNPRTLALGASLLACALSPVALGAVSEYTSYAAWSGISGTSVLGVETFNGLNGFHASGLSGSAGGVGWTASAVGGLYGAIGAMSTNNSTDTLTFSFSFPGGLTGVGGNIFATDINFNVLSRTLSVQVGLSDSTTQTFTRSIASSSDFWAFHSDGAFITSIAILPGSAFATIDNLSFMSGGTAAVVPLPGAAGLAAIALTGLSRRRRR